MSEPEMRFEYEGGKLVRVRCLICDWTAEGNGGASAFGQAWGAHANAEHPAGEPSRDH